MLSTLDLAAIASKMRSALDESDNEMERLHRAGIPINRRSKDRLETYHDAIRYLLAKLERA
jgi:hypothetical protein